MDSFLLQTKNLTKKFKKQTVLDDVSLSVRENTIYGLLGPNGAGKSTTLKMVTGMMKKTKGEILFSNHPWRRKDLLQIGALIENPPLYENLTAQENLRVRTILLQLPESRIQEVLEMVELPDTKKKKVSEFSMGMKQRLGIATALLNHPKLLILDEPTNGLDPIGILKLRDLILSFKEQKITVIVSSHILSEIEVLADDIGIISNGRLGYEGPIQKGEHLESLFLDIVRKSQKAGENK